MAEPVSVSQPVHPVLERLGSNAVQQCRVVTFAALFILYIHDVSSVASVLRRR